MKSVVVAEIRLTWKGSCSVRMQPIKLPTSPIVAGERRAFTAVIRGLTHRAATLPKMAAIAQRTSSGDSS